MIGKERMLSSLKSAISSRNGDQVEILSIAREAGCTRYANSTIHQNVHENRLTTYLRVVGDEKIGLARVPSIGADDLSVGLHRARTAAANASREEGFPGLPGPGSYAEIESYSTETTRFDHRRRANLLKGLFSDARSRGIEMAGALTVGETETAIINSNGVEGYQHSTFFDVTFTALAGEGAGYAGTVGVEATEAEISSLAKRAMDKAQEGDRTISLDPGKYTVILEPKALAELLEWTSYIAFGAKSYQDGTSFMAGKIGKKIAGENITIYDDGLESNGLPVAFDYEGIPKTRRDIVREGRAVGVVYDSLYAARDNTSSTGNATLPDSDDGPVPLNVFVEAGDMPVEELIASTPRGILVTRFHYVNGLLEPEVALMTGMTRDGTFLIEDGVLKNRVEEMRFTDSVLRMLNHVTGISRERESIKSWWSDEGVYTVPYVRIDDVSFTGKTG